MLDNLSGPGTRQSHHHVISRHAEDLRLLGFEEPIKLFTKRGELRLTSANVIIEISLAENQEIQLVCINVKVYLIDQLAHIVPT